MTQVKLIGGFYQAKSLIADAQKCINLYAEQNPPDAPFPYSTYPTPGLKRLSGIFSGGGQGLYTTTKGDLFAAAGGTLYYIPPTFVPFPIALLNAFNPVSMADNADAGTMIVVDGTGLGYTVNLTTRAATLINDENFYGGTRVDFVDGYFVLNVPGRNEFYLSNPFSTTFNPLFFAGKTGGGDPLVLVVALHRELWVFGTETTEVWDNTGQVDFPYQPLQGVFIQHGLAATASVATQDLTIYWLGQNKQGSGVVFRGRGYKAERISTHAIEQQIQSYAKTSDARGFIYQQEGHVFYHLTFPSAGVTWVWDETTQLWHQRGALKRDGSVGISPVVAAAVAYGKVILQDGQDGSLYTYDLNYGKHDLNYLPNQIPRVRSFPHLINDGKRLEYSRFIADMETGTAPATFNVPGATGDAINGQPQLQLQFSDDRGRSFSTPITQTFGSTGQENVQILWTRLGLSKDRIFQLSWSSANITSLNGAFIEVKPATS